MNGIYVLKGEYDKGKKANALIAKFAFDYINRNLSKSCNTNEFSDFVNQLNIIVDDNGKPYFKGKYDSLHFSVSHSAEVYSVIFSEFPCGIDVQEMNPKITLDRIEKISRRFFSTEEVDYIMNMDTGSERKDAFYRIWTMREAYGKMTGEGFFCGVPTFISEGVPINSIVYSDEVYSLKSFDLISVIDIPGYKCSICTVGESFYVK